MFLDKVVERAVVEQLQAFLEETSALDPFQSSFRPSHGMETAVFTLTDGLCRHLDQVRSVLLLLINLTAAFDTVDYDLSSHHFAYMEICGTDLKWVVLFFYG